MSMNTQPWTITERSEMGIMLDRPDSMDSVFLKADGCFEYHQTDLNPEEPEMLIHLCGRQGASGLDNLIETLIALRTQINQEWTERSDTFDRLGV